MEWNINQSRSSTFLLIQVKRIFFKLFAGLLLSGISFQIMAEAVANSPSAALGQWWEKSSLSYKPVPKDFLHHVEIDASYSNSGGNVDSTMKTSTVEYVARKSRWSNYFLYMLTDQKTILSVQRGSIEQRQWTMRDYVRYDLFPSTFLAAGFEAERDDPTFIKRRETLFAGLGYEFEPASKHQISLLAAFGTEDRKHIDISTLIPSAPLIADENDLDGVFIMNNYTWLIDKTLTFKQTADLMMYSDRKYGERWDLSFEMDINMMPKLYLTLSYKLSYSESLAQEITNAKKKDDQQTVGVKFVF